jgi:glycosyltransferase involved in cell wall biosynthesis
MITYNQEIYIREALESILNQITSFDFEIIIADDHSTDQTVGIIKEVIGNHQHGVRIKLKENQSNVGFKENFKYALSLCKSKYIAFCEGDDFWIDNMKLQRQFDFLEENEFYSFCTHHCNFFWESLNRITLNSNYQFPENIGFGTDYDMGSFNKGWHAGLQTLMFRSDIIKDNTFNKYKFFRDTHLLFELLLFGKGFFLNFVGSVYRIQENGVSSKEKPFERARTNYVVYKDLVDHNPHNKLLFERFKFFYGIYIDQLFIKNKLLGGYYKIKYAIEFKSISEVFGLVLKSLKTKINR